MRLSKTKQLTCGSVIAAVYLLLTVSCGALGIGYGPVQLRISEALCVLPVFSPVAVWGLAVGCLAANFFSFNPIDIAVGTAATLISALLTSRLRNIKTFGLPLVSLLPPVVVNAVFVGAETALIYNPAALFFKVFPIYALQIAAGQAISCYLLGIPLFLAINKRNIL